MNVQIHGLDAIKGYSAYEVAVINGFKGTEEEWLASLKGERGEQGKQGEPGTVVFEELTDEQKELLKGNPGEDGEDGKDGVSPAVSVTTITGGKRVTITDASGEHVFDIMDGEDGNDGDDGVSPGVSITPISGGHRITITDATGAHSFDVMNGKDGAAGAGTGDMLASMYDPQNKCTDVFKYVDDTLKGIDVDVTADEVTFADGSTFQEKYDSGELKGQDGNDGSNGVSPIVSVAAITGGHRITITDANGTKTVDVMDGTDGNDGAAGKDGTSVTVTNVTESTVDGGSNVVTFSDGKTVTIRNGRKGSDGAKGEDGKTPVKGTDYFTDADKAEMVNEVNTLMGAANTDYATVRARGIAIVADEAISVPNGCLCGVYTVS